MILEQGKWTNNVQASQSLPGFPQIFTQKGFCSALILSVRTPAAEVWYTVLAPAVRKQAKATGFL